MIADLSIKRPKFATVIAIPIMLAGGICFAPACIRSHVCPPAASCAAVSSVLSTYDQE